MRNKLYIATFSKDAVEMAAANGLGLELNHVCISENLDEDKMPKALEYIDKDLKEAKTDRYILHGPFTEIIPGSIDHRAVDLGLERLEEAYELTGTLGLSSMVVHSGYFPLIYYKEWHIEKSLEFWERFLKDKPNFTLYVENVFEDEPFMMKELIDKFNDPRLRMCLDVGHANVMTSADITVTKWIEELGPRIGHVHLHNNWKDKDKHQPLGHGTLDMDEIFQSIKENCSEEVTYTLESTNCRECINWLKERDYI